MPSIASLSSVRAYCGIQSGSADVMLSDLIAAAAPALAAYCNRDSFFSKDHVCVRDGTGSDKMVMANTPITAIQSVEIDGVAIKPSAGQEAGYQFVLGGRLVYLRGFKFTSGTRNVVIRYTAGYDDAGMYPIPADLSLAAKMYIAVRYREKDKLGISSKSLAGESISYSDARVGAAGSSTGGVPAAAANILENYMNYVPEYDL